MHVRSKFRHSLFACFLISGNWVAPRCVGQCSGIATTAAAVADCAARNLPADRVAKIDPGRPYTLAELIDMAEQNNPHTRIMWERAKQRAEALGIEKSAYFPVLAGIAAFGDARLVVPFPKPLSPRGYVMIETPFAQPEITLQYLIFDFGKREGKVDDIWGGIGTDHFSQLDAGNLFVAIGLFEIKRRLRRFRPRIEHVGQRRAPVVQAIFRSILGCLSRLECLLCRLQTLLGCKQPVVRAGDLKSDLLIRCNKVGARGELLGSCLVYLTFALAEVKDQVLECDPGLREWNLDHDVSTR